MQRIVFLFILLGAAMMFARCNSTEPLPAQTRLAIVPAPVRANTPTSKTTRKPSATATTTPTRTATAAPSNTQTRTASATFTPFPTRTATPTATKLATNVPAEQLALKHFLEGRAWLNSTEPTDVSKSAAQYFTGKALQQTLEQAQWEIQKAVRYKVGELTDNLWSGKTDEGILIFELTRAGKAVQYDQSWKPLIEFDVNPFSIVYVLTLDVKDSRWKVDHTKSAVDKVTGKSLLEE